VLVGATIDVVVSDTIIAVDPLSLGVEGSKVTAADVIPSAVDRDTIATLEDSVVMEGTVAVVSVVVIMTLNQ